jgi:hypothetical protein
VGRRDNQLSGQLPRSRPASTTGPSTSRALQGGEVDYTSVPSPRITSTRLGYTPAPLTSNQNRSPAYDRTSTLGFSAHRTSQSFGALSRYQNEEPDAETVMDQYVDYDGGVQADPDSPSPPPQQHSSPPQASRRLIHSPVANRSNVKQTAPATADQQAEDEDEDDATPTASHQAKRKQKSIADTEINASTKVNGKKHANLTDDEGDQEAPVLPRKSRTGRVSNDSVTGATPTKGKAVHHAEPVDSVQPETQFADDAGEDFGQDFADDDHAARDEPPETEQSGDESETVPKKAVKKSKEATKKSKGTDTEKKRRRKADDDPPRQTKKPRSNSAKPSSQGRARTPVESYLEGVLTVQPL